jgi:hypothetical protein
MPSRGELGKDHLAEINSRIPEAISLENRALDLNPTQVAMVFGPRSNRELAAAYLQDVAAFLAEARYALVEAESHWIWHTKNSPREENITALFYAQYYLDDAILRMYSTGEHAAGFVECYLSIHRGAIKVALEKNKDRNNSRLVRLGGYCRRVKQPRLVLSRIIALVDDASWTFVSDYRNKWVHEQRPRLEGLGISYRRQERWKKTGPGTFMLGIGGGDPPDLTIQEFFDRTISAYGLLRDLVRQCCDDLEAEVAERLSKGVSISSADY